MGNFVSDPSQVICRHCYFWRSGSSAIEKNPDLINNKETKFLRGLHVVSIFNAKQGESTAESQALSKALW
jgi:hypothetical protein